MKPNDDIVGKKIENVIRTNEEIMINLSNGMRIKVDRSQMVDDAGLDFPIGHWTTVRDGERIRTPASVTKDVQANPTTKTLLDRAYDLLTVKVADEPYGDGVHPNDYRAVLQKWFADYEEAKKRAQDYITWIEAKQ